MMKKDKFDCAKQGSCVYDAIQERAKAETDRVMKEIEKSRSEALKARAEAERAAQEEMERARNAEERTFICPSCNCAYTITRGNFNEKKECSKITFIFKRIWKEHKCPHCGSIVKLKIGTRLTFEAIKDHFDSMSDYDKARCALCLTPLIVILIFAFPWVLERILS